MKSSHPSGIGLEKNLMKQLEIKIVGSGETTKEGNQPWETKLSWTPLHTPCCKGQGFRARAEAQFEKETQETTIIRPGLPKISSVPVGIFGSQENLNLFNPR